MTILSSSLVNDNEHIIKMFLYITNCQNNKHAKANENSIMNIKFNFKCHLLIVSVGFAGIYVKLSEHFA